MVWNMIFWIFFNNDGGFKILNKYTNETISYNFETKSVKEFYTLSIHDYGLYGNRIIKNENNFHHGKRLKLLGLKWIRWFKKYTSCRILLVIYEW
jgi:hypothetical protein